LTVKTEVAQKKNAHQSAPETQNITKQVLEI
jgi:hypothetical protein